MGTPRKGMNGDAIAAPHALCARRRRRPLRRRFLSRFPRFYGHFGWSCGFFDLHFHGFLHRNFFRRCGRFDLDLRFHRLRFPRRGFPPS